MELQELVIRIYKANKGKIFKHIADDKILGCELALGVDDSIENYMEVDIVSGGEAL